MLRHPDDNDELQLSSLEVTNALTSFFFETGSADFSSYVGEEKVFFEVGSL